MKNISYFFQAQIIKLFMLIFKIVGLRAASNLGGLLGRPARKIMSRRPNMAADNLQRALPHLSADQRDDILVKNQARIGRMAGEFPHFSKIKREADTRIIIDGAEHVKAALPNGGAAIFATGHFSNWELIQIGAERLVGTVGSIYRPLKNPYIDRWILTQRRIITPSLTARDSSGIRTLIDMLKNDIPVGMFMDQRVSNGNPINFLGIDTEASPATLKLARRFDVPIIPTCIHRRDDGPDKAHFVQHFYPAIYVAKTDDMEADINAGLRQIYDLFEQWITERPEEWLWQNNRWKK